MIAQLLYMLQSIAGKVLSQRELEEAEIALVNWENYIVVQPLTSISTDFADSWETSGCNHSFLFP